MLNFEFLDNTNMILQSELDEMLDKYPSQITEMDRNKPEYINDIGWLRVDEWANETIVQKIEKVAKEIRDTADAFVLVGVGGSNNAARAVIEALQKPGTPEIIYMGNTLSPYTLNKQLDKLDGKTFYVDCIAKNFQTLEPRASFRLLRNKLKKQHPKNSERYILTTGTPKSLLQELSIKNGYRFFTFPTNIGGRFTAICSVSLLPMAVAGIDIRSLINGAKKMQQELFKSSGKNNMALRYACLRNLLNQKGLKIEMLSSFEPQLRWFYKWWIQMFAESEGTDEKGLFPVASEYTEELHSVGQYVQEGERLMFETFLRIKNPNASLVSIPDDIFDGFDYLNGMDFWEINSIAFKATKSAHSKNMPCITLEIDELNESGFGELYYFFEYTCHLSAIILGVNPYGQDGVEEYKNHMFKALGKLDF